MNNLISVIVPIYNLEQYIAECIESILHQTYKNIEIILVDDASTDDSAEICEKFVLQYNNIQFISVEQRQGVVHARNIGIQHAKGKYIGFVDGDDWIESTMYEELIKYIDKADLVACGVYRQFSKIRTESVLNTFEEGLHDKERYNDVLKCMIYDIDNELLQPVTPWIYNKLYLKEIVEQVYRNIDERIAYGEDSVFLYKYMMKSRSIYFIDKCLYHYRYRQDSVWHSKNDKALIHINMVYLSLIKDFLESDQRDTLIYQLQKWVEAVVCNAVNRHMGFDKKIRIPQFFLDTGKLSEMKIALYGAGQVGKDFYWQLKNSGYDVIAWVDNDSLSYRNEGLKVYTPEYLKTLSFDVVLIAVKSKTLAEEIRKELVLAGVEETKIYWKKPLSLY